MDTEDDRCPGEETGPVAERLAAVDEHIRTHLFEEDVPRREFLELFLLTVADRIALVDAALAEGDWREVSRLAHLIRGAAGHVGAARISAHAAIVELAAEMRDGDTARKHWTELTRQFRGLRDEARVCGQP
jgi:HPt (histidine-containing phosphotransfer) domain-containing protein